MSDSVVINVISPQTNTISINDTGENIYLNPLTLNQGIINHSVTHRSGGSDELLHNLLGGLQGGSGSNYYHLTSGEYANLVTGSVVRPSDTGNFIDFNVLTGDRGDLTISGTSPNNLNFSIDNSAITSGKLATNSVTTTKIADSSVSNQKLASLSVSTAKIANKAVTNIKLADMEINTIKGRISIGTSDPEDLSASDVRTLIDFNNSVSGLLSSYVTGLVVRPSETGNFITTAQTGAFYSISNPSGYITGAVVRPNETGSFLTAEMTDIRYVGLTGNQTVSGIKAFISRPTVNGTGVMLSGESVSVNTGQLTGAFYPLNSNPSGYVTGTVVRPSETGFFITSSQTGAFYPTSNPSGFVTGSVVRPSETGSFITTAQTGAFYPTSNPSGYITGVDLSAYVTGSVVRPSETGNFITSSQTGAFYPISNPSGFVTGSVVRPSETGVFITSSQTGAFYASSNPSGYVTGSVLRPNETANIPAINGGTIANGSITLQGTTDSTRTTSSTILEPSGGGVVVGSSTRNSSAIFQIDSTGSGFLPPRMTIAQRNAIVTPASGLIVYTSDDSSLNLSDGSSWANVLTTRASSFTSANLAAALTDETGTGSNVFSDDATLTRPVLSSPVFTAGTIADIATLNIPNTRPPCVMFDDFLGAAGNGAFPWADSGTGTTDAGPSGGAGLFYGMVRLNTGATSTNSRTRQLPIGLTNIANGATWRACFAIPTITDVTVFIGSNGGGSNYGLLYNHGVNSSQWVLSTTGATITTFTTAVAEAGNFLSGKRYQMTLKRVSNTSCTLLLEITDWNSAVWTTVFNGTITHASEVANWSAATPLFYVVTKTAAARTLMVDWFAMHHTGISR